MKVKEVVVTGIEQSTVIERDIPDIDWTAMLAAAVEAKAEAAKQKKVADKLAVHKAKMVLDAEADAAELAALLTAPLATLEDCAAAIRMLAAHTQCGKTCNLLMMGQDTPTIAAMKEV